MKDELIINGKKYVHTPEVKEERFSGYVNSTTHNYSAKLTENKTHKNDIRMIEIRDSEIIVSEESFAKKWDADRLGSGTCWEKHEDSLAFKHACYILGFKKYGV